MPPKVILWDLMDTLVVDPFFTRMADFFGITFKELLARKRPGAWRDFELARIDEAELFATFFSDGASFDGEAFKRHVEQSYEWLDGMQPLLAELAERGIPMHVMSNYSKWYRLCDARLGLSQYVTFSFVSCDTGVRKPDPEAYLGAARQLGLAPRQCLLIDDRPTNCDGAEAVGMPALLFKSASETRAALQAQRLL